MPFGLFTLTHMAHDNTMIDLARYLRCCNINAMIDTLDIPESTNKVQNSVYFNIKISKLEPSLMFLFNILGSNSLV